MKILIQYLDDVEKIERILLSCYGENGKSALIQASEETNTTNSYTLTNDGTTILNIIQIKNNHLYYLINKTVQEFSIKNHDNTKSMFIYLVTSLKLLLKPAANNSNLNLIESFKSSLRNLNLPQIFDEISAEFVKSNENILVITDKAHLLQSLNSISVFYNLETFNLNLSKISIKLIKELISSYLEQTSSDDLSSLEENLRQILIDLPEILEHWDRSDLEESKILNNQFLIDRKFSIRTKKIEKKYFKAILMLKQEVIDAEIEVKSNLSSILGKTLEHNQLLIFSNEFIEDLKTNEIDLIIAEGYVSDFKKSQLKLIDCSLIDCVMKEKILFLAQKLRKDPVCFKKDNKISQEKNVIIIEFYEILNENLIAFKPKSKLFLSSVLFCSPLKINFVNFKIYILKCVKSLVNLVSNNNTKCILIKNYCFEINLLNCLSKCDKIDFVSKYFLKSLFENLIIKFQKFKNIKDIHNFEPENVRKYEILSNKFECLFNCLSFLKILFKIDSICFVKSIKLKEIKNDDF
ncbi:unnamed protein product [Brachionus calyciflorus]|uniref:Uncharacterized protein n=1 Tax=Brachionus calyciflorus TaxID=104777 RepID=A0A813MB96_9BILA|nr:unnamed protein product [Brachionus calyciflorus]